jgi:hypothetical protein
MLFFHIIIETILNHWNYADSKYVVNPQKKINHKKKTLSIQTWDIGEKEKKT